MTVQFDTLRLEVEDGVAILTLAREERRNAICSRMNVELPQAWRQIERDPAVRVAIVTGAGNRTFCSGADLADLPRPADPDLANRLESISWTNRQNGVTKPVIAAVNGLTIGGGLHFLADADLVLCADTVRLIDTHVAVGLVAALEPVSLVRRMPFGAVMKLALTGGDEQISAAEAYRLGLADEVLPQDALMARARALAASIARHSPTAIARSKAAIWSALEMPLHEALEEGWRMIMRQKDHPDTAEGVAAFREKRSPNWLHREPGDLD